MGRRLCVLEPAVAELAFRVGPEGRRTDVHYGCYLGGSSRWMSVGLVAPSRVETSREALARGGLGRTALLARLLFVAALGFARAQHLC